MTAKKVKEENLEPVEETTEATETPEVENEEVAPTPVEETPAEEPTPVEEEVKSELTDEENVEIVPEPAPVEPAPVEPEPVAEPVEETKEEQVSTESVEEEYKQFSTITAPEEIRNIIEFYWVTSKDLYNGNVDNMWLKKDELKALKEWYATLA